MKPWSVWTWLVAVLVAVAIAGVADAQQSAGSSFAAADTGDDASCAFLGTATDIRSVSMRQVGQGWTFVLNPQTTLFQNRYPAAKTRPGPKFGTRVTIYAFDAGTSRVLLRWSERKGEQTQNLCGWVKDVDLMSLTTTDGRPVATTTAETWMGKLGNGPAPLRVGQIARDDRENILVLKGVLNNLNRSGDEGIPVYDTPNAPAPMGRLGLFEFYSVYAYTRGALRGNSRDHFLLGRAQGGSPTLVGWVHTDDFYTWNSRMAVYWAGTKRGVGWFNDDMKGPPSIQEVSGARFRDEVSARHRFPVLQMTPVSREVQLRAAEIDLAQRTPLALSELVRSYQVAMRIKSCRSDSDCLESDDAEKQRRDLQTRIQSLGRIDVLFLVDATESMDVYFEPTVQAIREFVRDVNTRPTAERTSFQFGVAVYGDYRGDTSSVDGVFYEQLAPLHDASQSDRQLGLVEAFARDFRTRAPRDPHADLPEAPFAALIRASRSNWRSDASIRIIVHLADHGNRDPGTRSGPGSNLVETLTVNDVVAELKRQRVLYVPVNVLGRPADTSPLSPAARAAFIRQARQIRDGREEPARRDRPTEVIQSYSDPNGATESAQQRQQAVRTALSKALEAYAESESRTQLRELCAVNPSDARCADLVSVKGAGTGGDDASRMAAVITAEAGLSEKQIKNVLSRRDTVAYAWIPPVIRDRPPPVETLTYWVALGESELPRLSGAFGEMCNALDPADVRVPPGQRLVRVVRDFITAASGDGETPAETDATRLGQALSLPFWERLEFLGLELRRINQMLNAGDPTLLLAWRFRFCRAYYLLSRIPQRERLDDAVVLRPTADGNVDTQAIKRSDLKRYHWWVQTERAEGFYYVPLDYLP